MAEPRSAVRPVNRAPARLRKWTCSGGFREAALRRPARDPARRCAPGRSNWTARGGRPRLMAVRANHMRVVGFARPPRPNRESVRRAQASSYETLEGLTAAPPLAADGPRRTPSSRLLSSTGPDAASTTPC
jgi:hypothetical protein